MLSPCYLQQGYPVPVLSWISPIFLEPNATRLYFSVSRPVNRLSDGTQAGLLTLYPAFAFLVFSVCKRTSHTIIQG
jgi:hypothetical protein